ncbi:hypothetical protein ACP70R_014381 [Stipagrostis hirtigluma subsp. patula]
MVTVSYRRNYIANLSLEDGTVVSEHDIKAGVLWLSFKERLGISEFPEMLYDLSELVHRVELPCLDTSFSKEEIDERCWNMIKQDFYNLVTAFEAGSLNMQPLNG